MLKTILSIRRAPVEFDPIVQPQKERECRMTRNLAGRRPIFTREGRASYRSGFNNTFGSTDWIDDGKGRRSRCEMVVRLAGRITRARVGRLNQPARLLFRPHQYSR